MADIGKAIRLRLLNDTAVTDLIGTRLYPRRIPQGVENPCAKYQMISSMREGALDGGSGIVNAMIQIDIFSDSHLEAETISEKIRERLQGFRGTESSVEILGCTLINSRELLSAAVDASDDHDYRVILEFEIQHQETIPTF